MSDNVGSVIFKSGLVENVGVQVEIASLSQAIAASVFPAAILDFRWKEGSDFFADGTIEKPVPENGGVDTGIVSLSGRWAKLEGGCKFAPPPAVGVTKKAPLFAG